MVDSTLLMVKDLPVIFLSYGEPNAEKHFEALQAEDLPHLGRVTDVKGFDAAHKAASALAQSLVPEAENFVTIDADNIVTAPWFWNLWLSEVQKAILSPLDMSVVSFRAVNSVNAACYGNGGVKIWSHTFAQNMRTHELTNGAVVDFCWDPNYFQVTNVASTTYPNGSALQALRAGYREGVKLTLADKFHLSPVELLHAHGDRTLSVTSTRLNQWATLGLDVPFGVWCCLGTLIGMNDARFSQEKALKCLTDYAEFHTLVYSDTCERYALDPKTQWVQSDSHFGDVLKKVGAKLIENGTLVSLPFSRQRSCFIKQAIVNGMTSSSKIERE